MEGHVFDVDRLGQGRDGGDEDQVLNWDSLDEAELLVITDNLYKK